MFLYIWLFLAFLCWGSFLNVVAYRLIYNKTFFTKRSHCPSCNATITWYDNIPILSWILLRARCRSCKTNISYLYPLIELSSAIIFTSLFFYVPNYQFPGYFVFFSALLVATRTDLQEMLISKLCTTWLIPVGLLLALLGLSQVSFTQSILGAILGYGLLWIVSASFSFFFKRKETLGEGDMELLAMIGSFIGIEGALFALLIGSSTGLVIGTIYLLYTKKGKDTKIPFGPFLSLGALLAFFYML